jgi:RNAse (barnase) inhibitor barstar
MNSEDKENKIRVNFDLEKGYDKNNTSEMTLENIFDELVRVLQEIDKMMDRKLKS